MCKNRQVLTSLVVITLRYTTVQCLVVVISRSAIEVGDNWRRGNCQKEPYSNLKAMSAHQLSAVICRGNFITIKKAHAVPATMNTDANKELRRQYVQQVSQYMRDGKIIVSMHDSVVVVCDNAPCHSKFHTVIVSVRMLDHTLQEECVIEHSGLTICRLGPYSPMLNPVETVWSKMKAVVKQRVRVPVVHRPGVGEQRLQYVDALIDEALRNITVQNIMNSCQHSQGFFQRALNLQDMHVGACVFLCNASPNEYHYILLQ